MLYTLLKPPLRAAIVVCLGLLFIGATMGGATAATLAGDDAYHLPAGQVIEDNLYVMAGEIIIDGTLDGDLVAMGGYIEVNGEIRGDVLAMGGGIVINGTVTGDVRIAGGGLAINGAVGGDLVSAGGGAAPEMLAFPLELNGRRIEQGTVLAASASIGKDALMTGGVGVIQGAIAGTLWAAMGAIQLDGTIGGDANLYGSQITVSERAQVGGTLRYSSDAAVAPVIPGGVAGAVEPIAVAPAAVTPPPTLAERLFAWTISVARALLGLLVLGWGLIKLAPNFTRRSLSVMSERAPVAFGVGLLVMAISVPAILLMTALAWLFWGLGGGLAFAFFLFGLMGVLWIVGPALVGIWLGQRLLHRDASDLLVMTVGVLVLLLLIRSFEWLPIAGGAAAWLLLVFTFAYAVGAAILAANSKPTTPTSLTPTGPPL